MRKGICLILLLLSSSFLFSETRVKEYSYFTIMGEIDLRTSSCLDEEILYRTLNHEGGMKIRVLEIGKSETYDNQTGVWLRVVTTAPMWVDNGEWIEKGSKYWIFLPDSMKIFNYEE